jgi:serine/threonine protein kinase
MPANLPLLHVVYSGVLGTGHFSTVRKGRLENGAPVAVKEFRIVDRPILAKEAAILAATANHSHVVKLLGLAGEEPYPKFVYSFHNSSRSYANLSISDFRWWLQVVLETLAQLHASGIVHRDIKLANIITHFPAREITLIDFGSADFHRPRMPKDTRVGSIRSKPPELAIGHRFYDCRCDVWSLGIACLDLMIGLRRTWITETTEILIEKLITVFGSTEWNHFANKYDPTFVTDRNVTSTFFPEGRPPNPEIVTHQAFSLVQKFLTLDPEKRLSAQEALDDPFFHKEDL